MAEDTIEIGFFWNAKFPGTCIGCEKPTLRQWVAKKTGKKQYLCHPCSRGPVKVKED